MKKMLKATAAVLAVSVTLMACTNSADDVKIDAKALDLYAKSSVTHVEEQPFTMNGEDGLYTGDWKGNRPEGYGDFIIGDYDYYSGEWYNGMLYGQAEMQRTYDDGTWKRFEGECAFNSPSGNGSMYIGSDYDSYIMKIEGDFSDESTLLCYMTDDVGKLVDIGGFSDGEYVSYVGNPDIEGINFTDWVRSNLERNNSGLSGYDGVYIGQTDENGIPNGYGYSVASHAGQIVYKLGSWKDGMIEGYYTEWRNGGERIGCVEGGRDVGECVIYQEYLPDHYISYKVIQMNCDTSYTYTLCDDGIYRTDYVTKEFHLSDGSVERQKYLTFKYDMDDYRYYYEGEFVTCDEDGNVLRAGIADTESRCSLDWISYEELEKRDFWNTIAPIVAIGVVGGVAIYSLCTWGNDFEGSAADRYLQRKTEESAKTLSESRKYDELMEKAREEERLGNTYNADKLREEAQDHKTYLDF